MKFGFKKGYILCVSPTLVRVFGQLTTGSREARGLAIFPFVFVTSESQVQSWLINHELIHFRQQLETLFLGLFMLTFLERLYARFILKKNKMERYLFAASEQEAYLNMDNPEYLKNRSLGSLFHYIRHKRKFVLIGPGQLEFLD